MKKGKKAAVITVCSIAALAIGGSAVYAAVSSKGENTEPVQTIEVEKMDLQQTITVAGTVMSEESSSIVSELINSEIKSVEVKVGDRVKKGDVIAVMDDSELQEQLARAEKMLASASERNDISISAAKRMYDTAVSDKNTNSLRGSKSVEYAREGYDKAVKNRDDIYNDYYEAVDSREDAEYEAEQAAQMAREAAAQAYYDSLSEEELQTLLEEGNRLWASLQK